MSSMFFFKSVPIAGKVAAPDAETDLETSQTGHLLGRNIALERSRRVLALLLRCSRAARGSSLDAQTHRHGASVV